MISFGQDTCRDLGALDREWLETNGLVGFDVRQGPSFLKFPANFRPVGTLSDWKIGGPGRDRTDDLFHAMEARSQLRHRPTSTREELANYCDASIAFSRTL